jgi:hypothetical protein
MLDARGGESPLTYQIRLTRCHHVSSYTLKILQMTTSKKTKSKVHKVEPAHIEKLRIITLPDGSPISKEIIQALEELLFMDTPDKIRRTFLKALQLTLMAKDSEIILEKEDIELLFLIHDFFQEVCDHPFNEMEEYLSQNFMITK